MFLEYPPLNQVFCNFVFQATLTKMKESTCVMIMALEKTTPISEVNFQAILFSELISVNSVMSIYLFQIKLILPIYSCNSYH